MESESQHGWTVQWVGVGWVFQLSVSVWVDSVVGGDGVGFSAVRVSMGGQCRASGLGWVGFSAVRVSTWVGQGGVGFSAVIVSVWVDSAVG